MIVYNEVMGNTKKTLQTQKLYSSLLRHKELAHTKLKENHPHAVKFLEKLGITPAKIREHAARILVSGAIASNLLLATPVFQELPKNDVQRIEEIPVSEREKMFSQELRNNLLSDKLELTFLQEVIISKLINDYWGINATPILEGKKLNHNYAYMGYEQHLVRYPGDNVHQHDEFQKAGIAPGKGAWGYFADSKSELTDDLIQKEKYYVAVQTLYLPDWNENWVELKEWYKYRKVVVVNPENGKTVVASIADSGPAKFTGKQFGGSPEVMEHLGLTTGKKKGKVILFFVNDPQEKIALGPVGYNQRMDEFALK